MSYFSGGAILPLLPQTQSDLHYQFEGLGIYQQIRSVQLNLKQRYLGSHRKLSFLELLPLTWTSKDNKWGSVLPSEWVFPRNKIFFLTKPSKLDFIEVHPKRNKHVNMLTEAVII